MKLSIVILSLVFSASAFAQGTATINGKRFSCPANTRMQIQNDVGTCTALSASDLTERHDNHNRKKMDLMMEQIQNDFAADMSSMDDMREQMQQNTEDLRAQYGCEESNFALINGVAYCTSDSINVQQ